MSAGVEHKLLLVETSGRVGQAALAHGAEVCARRQLDEARRHARDLAPAVQAMLQQQGWRPADITAVLVSQGPGSFTGLRVGIMAAKAFAYAVGCPIVAVETFAAIALQARPGVDVEVIADAQQQKLYWQRFRVLPHDSLLQAVTSLHVVSVTQWLAQLPPGIQVSGPGLALLRGRLPDTVHPLPEEQWQPQLDSLLRLGLARLARGERDDLWALEPLYARPSAAEAKWREA
jgi:tRNA threonylcarbamoyladenosine biosynthesis protein TsaB